MNIFVLVITDISDNQYSVIVKMNISCIFHST